MLLPSQKVKVLSPRLLILFIFSFILFFLVFYIFTNHIFIQSNSVNTVAFRPKMVAPIGALFQMFELIKNSYRCSSF